MKVMQVTESAQGLALKEAEVSQPKPAAGQILVRVHTAGVTTTELGWSPTTHSKSGEPRLHAIPGHEFSGVVAAVGENAGGFAIGQEVYGMNDWFEEGATAEYCLTVPSSIALKPSHLTHQQAATVPIGALTAIQGLFDRAKLQPGERVLVQGGSGAVGVFAVQFAHLHGAYVIATASSANLSFVKELGADEVLDYSKTRFEEVVRDIDVVFDTVGGETRERSRKVLKSGGRVISIAADGEETTDPVIRNAFFIVEPNQAQLVETATLIDAGKLKTFVKAAVPFEDAASAYAGTVQAKHAYGKIVILVTGDPTRS
jgi:NADPH:quinone reductase-like Zn-dependent oxidoreductase